MPQSNFILLIYMVSHDLLHGFHVLFIFLVVVIVVVDVVVLVVDPRNQPLKLRYCLRVLVGFECW